MKNLGKKWILFLLACLPLLAVPMVSCNNGSVGQSCDADDDCPPDTECSGGECVCAIASCSTDSDCAIFDTSLNCSDGCCL